MVNIGSLLGGNALLRLTFVSCDIVWLVLGSWVCVVGLRWGWLLPWIADLSSRRATHDGMLQRR